MSKNTSNSFISSYRSFSKKYPKISKALPVMVIAVVGSLVVLFASAATPTASLEAETAAPGNLVITDASASAGKAVKFAPSVTQPTGNFSVNAGKIYDPDGKEFIPIGANVSGQNAWTGGPNVGKSAIAHDRWHWNALRVVNCINPGCGTVQNTTNNNLDALITEYTAKKIVIMLEVQDFTGDIPTGSDLTSVINFWTDKATKYKNNPYVWFNLLNEPSGDPDIAQWYSTHATIATAIRNTGSKNMIVADASNNGQDFPFGWECPATYNAASQSAVLTKGADLMASYAPMMFSIHIYGWWGGPNCPDATRDGYVNTYVSLARQRGLAIMVGEIQGVSDLSDEQSVKQDGQTAAANAFFRRAPVYGLGMFWWYGNGSFTSSNLVTGSPQWYDINASASNLSEWGIKLRNYALQVNP